MFFWKQKEKWVKKDLIIRYIELFFIMGGTIAVMLMLRSWYRNDQEYQKTIPIIRETLLEIRPEEIENYLYEQEQAVAYICTAAETKCRDFEKQLKSFIEEKELQDKIVYLNISEVNQKEYLEKFNEQFKFQDEVRDYPALVLFKKGKIEAVVQQTQDSMLTIEQVETFLKNYEIEE